MSKETRDRIAFRMQPETRRRIEQSSYCLDNFDSGMDIRDNDIPYIIIRKLQPKFSVFLMF